MDGASEGYRGILSTKITDILKSSFAAGSLFCHMKPSTINPHHISPPQIQNIGEEHHDKKKPLARRISG